MEYMRSISGRLYKVHPAYREAVENGGDSESLCPQCGLKGHKVLKVTVTNHVDSDYWSILNDKWYWFCPNPSCSIVYYNNNSKTYIVKDEVKTKVFHKETSPSRPVCYCLAVTESVIREEILVKKCCRSLEDIQEYTKAGTGRWCPVTNPSGKCCKEYLTELVNNLLEDGTPLEVKDKPGHVEGGLRITLPKEMSKLERGRTVLLIEGMSCDGCSVTVRGALESIGLKVLRVSWKEGVAEIEDTGDVDEDALKQVIEDTGYRVVRVVKA